MAGKSDELMWVVSLRHTEGRDSEEEQGVTKAITTPDDIDVLLFGYEIVAYERW